MTDVEPLVADLAARGIRLVVDGADLVARPADRLTDADRTTLRAGKAEIVAHLRVRRAEPTWTADQACAEFTNLRERVNDHYARSSSPLVRRRIDLLVLVDDLTPIIDMLFDRHDYGSLRYALLDLERAVVDARFGRGWKEGSTEISREDDEGVIHVGVIPVGVNNGRK